MYRRFYYGIYPSHCREMNDDISSFDIFPDACEIENIAPAGSEIGVTFESFAVKAVTRVGIVNYYLILIYQPANKRGADKTGSTGYKNLFPLYHAVGPLF
jgi:hypothetical protein